MALVGSTILALPGASFAQPYNGYNNGNNNNGADRREHLSGRVTSSEPYNLTLDRSTHVVLHRGTVINPTGITLRRGMNIEVFGHWNRDGSFDANEVDVFGQRYQR
jgi:hypothetical protein